MIAVTLYYQGFAAVQEMLKGIELAMVDFGDLPEKLRQIMIDDNLQRGLSGLDLNSVSLTPILPESHKGRKGSGPPLIPEGNVAELIAGYVVEVFQVHDGAVDIVGSWPNMPQLHFHVTGYVSRAGNWVPARNPVGLTPQAQEQVIEALREWAAAILGGNRGG